MHKYILKKTYNGTKHHTCIDKLNWERYEWVFVTLFTEEPCSSSKSLLEHVQNAGHEKCQLESYWPAWWLPAPKELLGLGLGSGSGVCRSSMTSMTCRTPHVPHVWRQLSSKLTGKKSQIFSVSIRDVEAKE